MRLLITGTGGFVGRHLAIALVREGHGVVALMRRRRPSVLDHELGVRIESADLVQADALPAGPFDAVIHSAAAIPSAVPDETELTRINVDGSRRLFEHALNAGARTVILCSSMAVYGHIEERLVDPDTPVREPNAYGRSKLAGEQLLRDLCVAHADLRAVSIRLPGVVGAGSHNNFLSDTLAGLAAGEPMIVRNPDALFNNVVHVADLARFVGVLLHSMSVGHRIITIGAEHPLAIRDVVGILETAVGRTGVVRYVCAGHAFLVSSEAAKSLGYCPASVHDTVQRFAEAGSDGPAVAIPGVAR